MELTRLEEEGCAAIETGEVLGDEGTIGGKGMTEHLIEVGERLVRHHILLVCPDDAARRVVSAPCRSNLREGIDAPIRGEQAIEVWGLQFLDLLFVTPIPRSIDTSMGEEVTLTVGVNLVSQLEVGAMSHKELLEDVGKVLVIATAAGIEAEAVGGIMQVVVAQQEHHLTGLALLELENFGKVLVGLVVADTFLFVGINIVAQEDDGIVILGLHSFFPESAPVNIRDDK